jgi:hypothetical protein
VRGAVSLTGFNRSMLQLKKSPPNGRASQETHDRHEFLRVDLTV